LRPKQNDQLQTKEEHDRSTLLKCVHWTATMDWLAFLTIQ